MGYSISTLAVEAGGQTGQAFVLEHPTGLARAEVWPSHGFNCLQWQVRLPDGTPGDLLHVAPDWTTNPVPTRSGHPILFPFPNRFSQGQFQFQGKSYQLPLNESTGKHAIHGFTPRNAWRVIGVQSQEDSASVTGEFLLSKDRPDLAALWPADGALAVTYTLTRDRLRVVGKVTNHGTEPLPWGLGYHGYFRIPTAKVNSVDEYLLQACGARRWEAQDGIPSGNCPPVAPEYDYRDGKRIQGMDLDHLLTSLGGYRLGRDGLVEVARLSAPPAEGVISVWVSAEFRELLLFTPPHRQAVAIEPYSCASDAANLAQRGLDSGWRVLPRVAK